MLHNVLNEFGESRFTMTHRAHVQDQGRSHDRRQRSQSFGAAEAAFSDNIVDVDDLDCC